MTKQGLVKLAGTLLGVGLLSTMLMAQSAARFDNQIQTAVTHKLASKSQFGNVKASVEDGIVTLTGTVDLYQGKLDAAKMARKTANAQGVRNLLTVAGPNVSNEQLEQKLAKKLRYVRVGYDNTFDYFALGVKDGVVTVEGQDRTGVGRDEAMANIANMPGALRVIYSDSVLSKYATDPARPIRIIVANGHVTLYGSVDNKMDKDIAGIRANQLPGAFSVDNKLEIEGKSAQNKL